MLCQKFPLILFWFLSKPFCPKKYIVIKRTNLLQIYITFVSIYVQWIKQHCNSLLISHITSLTYIANKSLHLVDSLFVKLMVSRPSTRVHVLKSCSIFWYKFRPFKRRLKSVFDSSSSSSPSAKKVHFNAFPSLRPNLIRLYFMVTNISRARTPSGSSITTSTSSSPWLHDTWWWWQKWGCNSEGWPLGSESAWIYDSWMKKIPAQHQVRSRSGQTGSALPREL